ncbi:MAG: GNAT family N-acetyltransferase [Acetobacteraceae bacterium]|nr:GNAT family N-acetyltransferase [Acetobacteraceae bacterium]
MYRGNRVELVAVEREHLTAFLAWMNDPATRRLLSDAPILPLTLEDEERWLVDLRAGRCGYVFSIVTLEGRRLVGNCCLKDVDWPNRRAAAGIVIGDPADRGRGLGRDAIQVLLEFAFRWLGLNRVEVAVGAENEQALCCYRACGFSEEGRRREFSARGDGFEDEVLMAVLRREWKQQRGKAG